MLKGKMNQYVGPQTTPIHVGWPGDQRWAAGGGVAFDYVERFAVTANKLYAAPLLISSSMGAAAFNQISLEITTGAVGNVRMGIYANDYKRGYPTDLVLDAGTADTAVAAEKALVISKTLPPAWYWLACIFDGTPSPSSPDSESPIASMMVLGMSVNNPSDPIVAGGVGAVSVALTYGALPAVFPTGGVYINAEQCPGMELRTA